MATLTHNGYIAVLDVDLDAGELFGRTVGMRDLITFQGKTVEEARKSFRESIDFYLECCQKEGKPADRPYSGRFNVRITPQLHRSLAILAETRGLSLNDLVGKALAGMAGEAATPVSAPELNWREVKAQLEKKRPKGRASQNGGPGTNRPKSTGSAPGHTVNHRRK